ncbi:hypothetical protein B7463_g7752, partial [Scytalidium lignicola]
MAARAPRTNEYFVPKDGIDREVITADICRYLGNDALVRPGTYENPQTRQIEQGYFITAYRNLTSAMIADLKADSERWEAERRQSAASRGAAPNVEYRSSTTHHSRQYYGPTTEASPVQGYTQQPGNGQGVYESVQYQQQPPQQYQQQAGYGQQVGYAPAPGYPIQDNNYYIAGADMPVAADRRPPQGAGNVPVPRSAAQYPPTSQAYQADARSGYYTTAQAPQLTPSGQYSQPPQQQQQPDAFYARGPADYNSPEPIFDARQQYQDTPGGYAPVSLSSTTPPLPATAGAPRHRNERDDRDRRDHRRR